MNNVNHAGSPALNYAKNNGQKLPVWLLLGAGFTAVLVCGCGRNDQSGPAPDNDSSVVQARSIARAEGTGRPVIDSADKQPFAASDDGSMPAMLNIESMENPDTGPARVTLIAKDTGEQVTVGEGDYYRGRQIIKIDAVVGIVQFERNGISEIVGFENEPSTGLDGSGSEVVVTPGEHNHTISLTDDFEGMINEEALVEDDRHEWPAMIDTDHEYFEPLDFEREQGIDPNHAVTWPPDYQGPAIERAQRGIPLLTFDELEINE